MAPAPWSCETGIDIEKKHHVVIIGAGPTGLGATHRLTKLGVLCSNTQVIILEQQETPGGLVSSHRDQNGFLWDNGGHVVFSNYPHYTQILRQSQSETNILKLCMPL